MFGPKPGYGALGTTGIYLGYGNVGTRIAVMGNTLHGSSPGALLQTHYSFGDLALVGNIFHQAGPAAA